MAHVDGNYPLMYEGISEKGLAIAALNFVGYAKYSSPAPDKFNLAPHEVIPFILCQCSNVKQAAEWLDIFFSMLGKVIQKLRGTITASSP